MNNKKNKLLIYLFTMLFGFLGVYLTFFTGKMKKYDSQIHAYKIDPNEKYNIEDGTTYQPIYYFKINENDYKCESKTSSSSYPSFKKNIVYYDRTNPTTCLTEYEQSSSRVTGIICLVVTSVLFYFAILKKPSNSLEEINPEFGDTEEKETFSRS